MPMSRLHACGILAFVLLLAVLAPVAALAEPADDAVFDSDEALKAALLDLGERDREARKALVNASTPHPETGGFSVDAEIIDALNAIDAESTAFIERMVEARGWPTISEIGKDGSRAAFLLAQHADKKPELQARVLELMTPLLERDEVSRHDFALLTDRVRVARGEPQLYGSQFGNDETGTLRPMATEDWDKVDARRAEMGLPPIAEYAQMVTDSYGPAHDLTPLPLQPPVDQ